MKRKLLLLLVSLIIYGSSVYAQSNHWNPSQFNLPANCNIWWSATLDGEALASADIEVAAFVEGECRASARMGFLNNTVGQMQVPHSGVVEITFKMYDHASDTEYDNCSTTITTSADEEILGVINQELVPIVFAFTSPTSFGPAYPWVAPIGVYPNNMSVTAEIQIDGVPVTETERWELAAFCGDDCRGDQKGLGAGPFGPLMYLTVYGEDGDVMNFYLYDMDNEEVYLGVCSATVIFSAGESYGYPWEPFVLNFKTVQTFTKDILPYTEGQNDRYYLIASPIGTVDVTAVDNLITESAYDLYFFDQSGEGDETYDFLEWRNYDAGEFTQLEAGKGYLYANSADVTLIFTGAAYDGDATFPLDYDADANLNGWNLVGNPFAVDVYPDRPYYKMNEDGTEIMGEESSEPVAPMEGVFVVANEEGETVTFNIAEGDKNPNLVLNLSKNSSTIDRVIVRFDEGRQLPKFQLNPNHTKVYVSQEGNDYAIVNASEMGEMPVSFKAENSGSYTMSFTSQEVSFNYLHLIDNMTGADVDLLATPSYSFDATKSDYPTRFKLVFATGNNSDDNFAFFNNDSFVISNEGEATLQVVDVKGRILKSETIKGSASVSVNAASGIYMLRLINGDNVKVQKVVVE